MAVTSELNIERAIQNAVRLRTEEILTEEVAAIEGRVRERLTGIADQIALGVMKHYEIESGRNMVTIRVKKDQSA